jgi:thiol-disulfide isomerase/thioredoxin
MRGVGAALLVALAAPLPAAAAAAADVLELRVAAPDATPHRLGDIVGRGPALVAMAASYCPPCRAEVPVLARAARRWRNAGLRVLAVMVDVEDARDVRALARAWGIDYDVYAVAPGQEHAIEALLAHGVPAAFLVKDGHVARHDRFLSDADLEALVPRLLERDPPPAPAPATHTRSSTPAAGSPVARATAAA